MSFRMLIPSIRARIKTAQRLLPAWLNPDESVVRRVQLEGVKLVWADAVRNVPYYKRLVNMGEAPKEISSLEEFFANVPKLEKKTIQDKRDEFVRVDRRPDLLRATGGSTGQPFQFGVFKTELEDAAADALVGRMARGMNLESDRMFIYFGYPYLLGSGWAGRKIHLERRVRDWLLGYKRQDAYRLDKERAKEILNRLASFNPHVFYGYSCAIDALARLNGEPIERALMPALKLIIVTAEPLPRDDSKNLIQQCFGAPVVFEFGGVDFGSVAYEKPDGKFGVFWWNQLAEIEDDGRGDNSGPLLLTPLYVRYVPLIRYYSGDCVSGARQTRDRGILEFESLEGRVNDMISVGEGSIHSVAFAHCLKDEPNILGMQLILEEEGIRLMLVGQRESATETRMRRRLADLSPLLKDCSIEYAEDLETTHAGKRRWIVDRRNIRT